MNLKQVGEAGLLLLGCLTEQLEANAPNPPVPQIISLRPGTLVGGQLSTEQDECKCGVAWVRLVTLGVANTPEPTRLASGKLCGPDFWTAQFELGVLRCWNMGDADTIPSPDQLTADALATYADAQAMASAALCCAGVVDLDDVGDYTPVGPEGLCLGGTTTVTVRLDGCC